MARPSRREQAQAHAFLSRRLSAALLAADPESVEQPMRRLGRASLLGVMVAVLAVAAVTVLGYVHPGGSTSWRQPGMLIVDRDTSTRYVYTDGLLHPVLNYTSARLLLGSAQPPVAAVSASSLAGVPRGLPVGIPGAPDDLPPAAQLARPPWTVCTQPIRDGTGTLAAGTVLSAGIAPTGTALTAGSGLLVRSAAGALYLLWQGHRLLLAQPQVRTALGFDATAPVPMGAGVLSVIPAGPVLGAIAVAGAGGPGPSTGDRPGILGAVYRTAGGQSYLLTPAGLQALSPLQAQIQLDASDYPGPGRAALTVPGGITPVPASSAVDGQVPASPPVPVPADPATTAVCVTAGDAADLVLLSLGSTTVDSVAGDYVEPDDATGGAVADRAVLPAGAALVRAQPAPGLTIGTQYLVTPLGVKYAIGDADTAKLLGYAGVAPTVLPAAYVQLLRTGPVLDKAGAGRTSPVQPGRAGTS